MQGVTKGILLAITGALCWGIQGPISQFLFQDAHFSPSWLMSVKMPLAGILILLFTKFIKHQPITKIWRSKRSLSFLLLYAVCGLSAVQYFYLVLVKLSNAGIATILQNLGIVLIVIFTIIIYHRFPTRAEMLAIVAAMMGTWLLVTKGRLLNLSISHMALLVGILLATAGALQTMLPVPLLKRFPTIIVIGWSMVIGGALFMCFHPFWLNPPQFTFGTVAGVAFIVLFGTMMSFLCFIGSLNYISPTVTGMLDTFEPASATLGAVLFLGTSFNGYQVVGGILILSTVFILALGSRSTSN